MGNQKRQLFVPGPTFIHQDRQLSFRFPSAFRVTHFHLPVSGPLRDETAKTGPHPPPGVAKAFAHSPRTAPPLSAPPNTVAVVDKE